MAITVKSGNIAPVSGLYKCETCESKGVKQEVTLAKGDKVPPCRQCHGSQFRLVRKAQH